MFTVVSKAHMDKWLKGFNAILASAFEFYRSTQTSPALASMHVAFKGVI